MADSKWIDFLERPPNPKTRLWRVVSKKGGDSLGRIEWYGPWRKYAFEPHESTVYEEDCLRDIAAFVEARTREHRERANATKPVPTQGGSRGD